MNILSEWYKALFLAFSLTGDLTGYFVLLYLQHVGVQANVVDAMTGLEQTTNDFRFTWYQDADSASPNLRQVVPKTYKGSCSEPVTF